jgi:hypothetical protein
MQKKIIFILLTFCLVNCVTNNTVSLKDFTLEPITLPLHIESIKFIDDRDSLVSMNWKAPGVSTKKGEKFGNPVLNEYYKSEIERIILKSANEKGIPANIEFTVLEGYCKLNFDWKSVTEYAKFKGTMRVNIPSRSYSYTSKAEILYENPTYNGTEAGTLKLYHQAVKNVTWMNLKQIAAGLPN